MKSINYSIIIPHYNVPELLLRCMHSIPCRDDVEIIVIDDCSENFDICKNQLIRTFTDYNIQFYSTDHNSGPGAARNIGLDHASGEWIIFEDADDFFAEDINNILNLCINRNEDILFCHCISVMCDDITKSANDYMYEDIIEQYINYNNDEGLRYGHFSVCGRLIRRSFIEKNAIRFREKFHGEDLLFAVRIGNLCETLNVLPYCLDVVACRMGSLSRSWRNWGEWYLQFFPAHIEAMHYLHERGLNVLDASVYGKLFIIMKLDFCVFRTLWSQLHIKEKFSFLEILIKKLIDKTINIIGESTG